MADRTTVNGMKRLFRNKCCTHTVSLVFTVMVLGSSTAGFVIFLDQFFDALYTEFGAGFWANWGCEYSGYYCTNYCSPKGWICRSDINYDVGLILWLSTYSFYVIFCFYTWFGSWCCTCCCPGVEEETLSTTSISVHYAQQSSETSTPLISNYVLYVHFGEQFPTKLALHASSLEELTYGIRTSLNITQPFKIAVFDDTCNQYVLVTSLSLVPNQATLQLMFN